MEKYFGMDAGKDIYRVSVPMVAGVLTAAAFFSRMGNTMEWGYITAGVTYPLLCIGAAAAAITMNSPHRPKGGKAQWQDGSRPHRPKGSKAQWQDGSRPHSQDVSNQYGKNSGRAYNGASAIFRNPLFWVSAFYLLGICCYANRSVMLPWTSDFRPFSRSNGILFAIISDISFRDRQNNMLVQALILGDRTGMSKAEIQAFRGAGAAHLLALSGMHLGIIYLILNKVLAVLGNTVPARKCRNIAVILLTGAYTLMCGCGASLMRAWLFILVNEGAKFCSRRQPPGQVFCTALTLHLVLRPESISDVGFQLSYLAMVGIVFVWPHMRGWWDAFKEEENDDVEDSPGRRIWDAASLSLSCQLFTSPLTLLYFGTFPKYFLITNLVAAPLMTIVMLSSLLAICATAIGMDFQWLLYLCEAPISLLRFLIGTISSI